MLVKKGQKGKCEYSQLRLNAEDFNGQLVLAITTWGAVHSYHTHLTNNYFLQKVNFLLRRFLAPRLLSLSTLKTISLTGICSYYCKHFYLPCCHHPSCARHLSPSESGHPVHLFNSFPALRRRRCHQDFFDLLNSMTYDLTRLTYNCPHLRSTKESLRGLVGSW